MSGHPLTRHIAQSTLDALKKAGHIVLAAGGSEQVLRDLDTLIDPVLARVMSKLRRTPIMGEISSTFGDEATDEAVEELVASMREALLDSDGVEDVFADDRIIERLIFRTFADEVHRLGQHHEEEEEERPPISVRLDTLGYVAAAAAKSSDAETLRDALDRAAEAAQSELKTFDDKTRTAFFRPVDPDPERRLDIEEAIEEELSELVDAGVVELPTVRKVIPIGALPEGKRKALRKKLDDLAQKHLMIALCPGSWDWSDDKRAVHVIFTPLTEPEPMLIDRATEAFRVDVETALANLPEEDPAGPVSSRDKAPTSARRPDADGAKAPRESADIAFAMRILKAASGPPKDKPRPAAAKAAEGPASSRSKAKASSDEAPPSKPAASAKPKVKKPAAKAEPEKAAKTSARKRT